MRGRRRDEEVLRAAQAPSAAARYSCTALTAPPRHPPPRSVPTDIANPRQLSALGPSELSFWVASLFAGNPYQVHRVAAAGAGGWAAGRCGRLPPAPPPLPSTLAHQPLLPLVATPCCAAPQQQALLEEETTIGRLTAVKELLGGTQRYLSAQAALQSAFKTTGGAPEPPAGGPD